MPVAAVPIEEVVRVKFRGPLAAFVKDDTRFIDLEGALSSGKTTACLWKEWLAAVEWFPGIWSYIGRFSDGDNQSKLVPAWNRVCEEGGVSGAWDAQELCFKFANGSRVYTFGLKSQDERSRYAKLRGLGVGRIYIDQAEELPPDFFQELVARLRQPGFPHQLTLSPNPMDENSWLSEAFPEDNSRPDRRYVSVSLFDNAHNLPPEAVQDMLHAYPATHAKHRSAILGRRGLNVIGTPVYAGAFNRAIHVRPLTINHALPLEEGIDFGKHHPCIVWRQRTPYGGVQYLGGLMGQSIYLEDFLPLAKMYREQWFPGAVEVMTCCDPAGSHDNSQGVRSNGVGVLQDYGFSPTWKDDANRPSVRYAMIERTAGLMRRRTAAGEAFGIHNDPSRWLRITGDGRPPSSWGFMADGCEAGYVWDGHLVSEGSKQYRKAKKDGWYEHGQNVNEYLELNFGSLPLEPREIRPARDAGEIDHERMLRREYGYVRPRKSRVGGRAGYGG